MNKISELWRSTKRELRYWYQDTIRYIHLEQWRMVEFAARVGICLAIGLAFGCLLGILLWSAAAGFWYALLIACAAMIALPR